MNLLELEYEVERLRRILLHEDIQRNWLQQIDFALELLNLGLQSEMSKEDAFSKVAGIFESLYRPKHPFGEFYIQRKSRREQLRLNQELSEIHNRIWQLIQAELR